jgi:hypothetical protein
MPEPDMVLGQEVIVLGAEWEGGAWVGRGRRGQVGGPSLVAKAIIYVR